MADEIKDDKAAADATAKKMMDGNSPDGGGKAEEKAPAPVEKAKTEEPVKYAEPAKTEEPVKPTEPIKYELKLPEGSLLDASAIDETAAFAKEQGLSNKAAQALLDQKEKLLTSNAEKQKEIWNKETQVWLEVVKADPEIGGEAFGKNAELAKRVVDRFGSKAFKEGLSQTGFGNHPEMVRFVVAIGKAMDEDKLVLPGSKNSAATKDLADVFYGGQKETEKKE